MASNILSPNPHLLSPSSSHHSKLTFRDLSDHRHPPSWLRRQPTPPPRIRKSLTVGVSMEESIMSSSSMVLENLNNYPQNDVPFYVLGESAGYSMASYYTSLGLFVISVPGLWSLIKRSVKSKVNPSILYESYSVFFLFIWLLLHFCVCICPQKFNCRQ